jgi:hypothetical protein
VAGASRFTLTCSNLITNRNSTVRLRLRSCSC